MTPLPIVGASILAEQRLLRECSVSLDLREDASQRLATITANLAGTLEESYERFVRTRRNDPFPHIPPALLSSAHVCRYIVATGMIHDIPLTVDTVKIASLDLPLGGPIIYWEGAQRCERTLSRKGDSFVLQRNSIAFVTLQPYLMLPDYIAMRFNFRITNVYRGLLLGTGPLVDPGYQGRLSFPIHNLTETDYTFSFGDAIITAEFTKVGLDKEYMPPARAQAADIGEGTNLVEPIDAHGTGDASSPFSVNTLHVPFPEPHAVSEVAPNRNLRAFVNKAGGAPVRSSLAEMENRVAKLDLELRGKISQFGKYLRDAGGVGIVAIMLSLATLATAVFDAHSLSAQASVTATAAAVQEIRLHDRRMTDSVRLVIDSLRASQQSLQAETQALRDSIRLIRKGH